MPRKLPRILIVDDDTVTCELLCEVFAREGFEADSRQGGEAALSAMAERRPDVLLSDIRMKTRLDGLSLLERARREHPATPVVLMTAFGSIETAIRAVKEGAFDYISKPFDIDELVATVRRALGARAKATALPPAEDGERTSGIIGRTPAMLEVYKMIARVSDASAAVLITGESGTGKELVARAIHTHGARQDAPFVAVNCGALTETLLESELFGHVKGSFTGAITNKHGLFEQAGEGTVFLDEISETSPALQVKLLRVLQEREVVPVGGAAPVRVRARVIAASNCDLEELSAKGAFRHDLLYRLNVIQIHLSPLRERREDIPLLVAHLARKHTPAGQSPPAIDDDAMRALTTYSWPGNVRELENSIERAITLSQGGRITPDDLPPKVRAGESKESLPSLSADDLAELFSGLPNIDEIERRYLLHVLEATGGNRKRAAEILGINRKTLYRMAARFRLDL
ncbi:MAG: sigma-54 dependent transcriptional regulator [Acidobacteriota bacterium]|nr:sigma-54 dependent transcriptional regulator [Acidobacteriota bacterium]MDQ5836027.1 sigma-54 dependent transcriptional regulator [Acidobacteriota bacterium]